MSVEVDICNSALIKLGATPITALTDETKEARLCNYQFAKIRDSVLRSAPWNFATRRILLSPLVATLEWGELNQFQLPSDCVRFWKVSSSNSSYSIEGTVIVSADETIQGFYISNLVPVSKWDANFKEALANMLAADLCYAMTQSTSLKASLESSGEFWINQARSHNSQEVTPENFRFDGYINGRYAGYNDEVY